MQLHLAADVLRPAVESRLYACEMRCSVAEDADVP